MIHPFQFARLPKIIFGAGKISLLPGLVGGFGKSAILVTGKKSFSGSPGGQVLWEGFRNLELELHRVTIPGEPSVEMVNQEVERFRDVPVDVVVAIGGGSVLDAGKALSAMMHRRESIEEFLEGIGNKEHPGTKVPFVAVPTTAGTGSEATKNAVISKTGGKGYKRSLRHDNFVPDIALVDPELVLGCPRDVAVACGMDCFVQLTEAFLSTGSGPYTNALAMEGLRAVKSSLLPFLSDTNDDIAASGMSFAALTSGICLANAGLGVIHGFASSVGGLFDIPHGVICGKLMALSQEINVRELRKKGSNPEALRKYAGLGRLFTGISGKEEDDDIDGFIRYLTRTAEQFQLPGFRQYGVKEADLENICRLTGIKSNPVDLSPEDLMEIISSALS